MIEKCDVSAHQEISPCLGDGPSRRRARIADHSHRPSLLRLLALSTDVVPAPPHPIVQTERPLFPSIRGTSATRPQAAGLGRGGAAGIDGGGRMMAARHILGQRLSMATR